MAAKAKIDALQIQQALKTFLSVVLDFKILALIVLNILILYMGTWDTVLRPCLEQMEEKKKAIDEQKKQLTDKQGLDKQYSVLDRQLKSMSTQLIAIPAGNSAKVVSVTEAAELLDIIKGNHRDESVLPRLLPPHDQRSEVSLTFLSSTPVDLLKPESADSSATKSASESTPSQSSGTAPSPLSMARAQAGSEVPLQAGSATLEAERFDYELKVTGTYPALVDVLNQLVLRKKLIRISQVVISRPEKADPQPSAQDHPDFPVKLDMTAKISLYLYTHGAL